MEITNSKQVLARVGKPPYCIFTSRISINLHSPFDFPAFTNTQAKIDFTFFNIHILVMYLAIAS